ncbi:hypothetical protein WR25_08826 [Diploscapter pachys]|uniref:Uncharacterized protein n=1 Tax=Diploscapter pachys TaxID=2018661 RepID=A0A2A2JAL8_9BILA|nr:hypothetical protein WR25_08826 [Diploscapter pachys]
MADDPLLHYMIYRDGNATNESIIRAILEETKSFVFDKKGITLSATGYSGIPLKGTIPLNSRPDDVWRIVDVLFKMSQLFEGLVFNISTENEEDNIFYQEAKKNEVLPKWVAKPNDFNSKVFGIGGVLHVIPPEVIEKHSNALLIDIVRMNLRECRNILVTESIKQQVHCASARDFGMQRAGANLPESVAYLAKQRPDLLSAAESEEKLEKEPRVMVHILLNERDWKAVTAVADIESPADIVSHRVSIALLEFDAKYTCYQNGTLTETEGIFGNIPDAFERERLNSLHAALLGKPHSLAHRYQMANALVSSRHQAECKKLFVDGASSSTEARDSVCSGDDEGDEQNGVHRDGEAVNEVNNAASKRKQIYKKRKGDLGKKRTLAPIGQSSFLQPVPVNDEDLPTPTTSNQLRNFERAVNGDDLYYKASSDDQSLGEDEDMGLFVVRSKSKPLKQRLVTNGNHAQKSAEQTQNRSRPTAGDDDNAFDLADLLRAAPPIATREEEDFSDI